MIETAVRVDPVDELPAPGDCVEAPDADGALTACDDRAGGDPADACEAPGDVDELQAASDKAAIAAVTAASRTRAAAPVRRVTTLFQPV